MTHNNNQTAEQQQPIYAAAFDSLDRDSTVDTQIRKNEASQWMVKIFNAC